MCFDPTRLLRGPDLPDAEPLPAPRVEPIEPDGNEIARRRAARERERVTRNSLLIDPASRTPTSGTGLSIGR